MMCSINGLGLFFIENSKIVLDVGLNVFAQSRGGDEIYILAEKLFEFFFRIVQFDKIHWIFVLN